MVIVQGTYRLEAADRDAFVGQSLETMLLTRSEPGCLEYVLAADPVDPGRVILSERWESMEDLNTHTRALNQRRRAIPEGDSPPAVAPLSRDFGIYEIASVQHIS
jgi:quinol monooxygenase YgiN